VGTEVVEAATLAAVSAAAASAWVEAEAFPVGVEGTQAGLGVAPPVDTTEAVIVEVTTTGAVIMAAMAMATGATTAVTIITAVITAGTMAGRTIMAVCT
jgi:hypothetical protein